ncbi:hypothetical protein UA75_11660 [Actinoalloteichus sp. GBA129-24]|uniref:Uncharacterized protein n=1 Tax=Actinoalloteichus fjordicus TaxID=1612552 RepID=A0AAC9PRU4_9PSEU|nr:hypothetical protein UA74_11575 [Actinoalloteichus fjordicus]APU20344.1 hypothetical protein UA75_11660 [Actinoalloteichus sp. GBA129-24]
MARRSLPAHRDLVFAALAAGDHSRAAELSEAALFAVQQWQAAPDRVQTGLIHELLDAHAEACRHGARSGPPLADWLLKLQLDRPGLFDPALVDWADALGAAGLAAYRHTVEAECAGLPVVPYGGIQFQDRRRRTVLRMTEELADHLGCVDLTVLQLSRDLSTGWQYLRIAVLLHQRERGSECLDWVERGLAATRGTGADEPLLDLAMRHCRSAGLFDQALRLRWEAFAAAPSLDGYRRLRAVAVEHGCWEAERHRVLGLLRDPAGDQGRRAVLIEILIWEGDVESAWAAALRYGCPDELRRRLVDALARTGAGPTSGARPTSGHGATIVKGTRAGTVSRSRD